jgi:rod shape-determining protein MreD
LLVFFSVLRRQNEKNPAQQMQLLGVKEYNKMNNKFIDVLKKVGICLIILLLQFVFADRFRIFGIAPNIAFAFIVSLALIHDFKYNIYAAGFMGFFLDGLSGRVFGVYTLLFVLINFLVFEFYHSAFSENLLIEMLYGLIASFAYSVIFAFFTSFFKGSFITLFAQTSFFEFIYNFLIFTVFLIAQKNLKSHRKSIFKV